MELDLIEDLNLTLSPNQKMFYTRESFTIAKLKQLHDEGLLLLNPSWQREGVWNKKKKPALIESILNEIPIPEITLWLNTDNVYVTVDGQQRLRAIIEYMADDYSANQSYYSDLTEEEAETLDNTIIEVLLLGSENPEDRIIAYYKLRNSTSTALVAGELIKADSNKPIVIQTLQTFKERESRIESIFGKKKPAKRSADLPNTVPYLASTMHGGEYLTRAYPSIEALLVSVKQEDVEAQRENFNKKFDMFLTVCNNILSDPANVRLKSAWKGFPPLGKVSAIWMTILNPDLLRGRELNEFWVQFYKTMHGNEAFSSSWDTFTRKNGKINQIQKNIDYAHKVSKPA
jgi:hypothetical protein